MAGERKKTAKARARPARAADSEPPASTRPGRRTVRVAVVGGGCAGVAAAWHLSGLNEVAGHPERYEITVYEGLAQLGGKGASVRDARGRILEHGLHIWLGFYENAFAMMRSCYDTVRDSPDIGPGKARPLFHGSFDEAFFAEPQIGLAAKNAQGAWEAWTGYFPPMPGLPGDPFDAGTNPFSLTGYLRRALGLVKMLIQSVVAPPGGGDSLHRRSDLDEALDLTSTFDPRETPNVLVDRMAKLLRVGVLGTAAGWLQGVTLLETMLRRELALPLSNLRLLKFVEALTTQARRLLTDVVAVDPVLRRKTEIIDLVMTITVGLVRDKVLTNPRGLDSIDDIDCRDWLRKHGATGSSLDSPFVMGLYDLAFAYRSGDKRQPGLAAGQALRGALRMFFSYRGAMFWRMRSGMGEVVFAPLYRVLSARGVEFRFLHSLVDAEFSEPAVPGSARRVTRLSFEAQGNPKKLGDDPLDDTGCWPAGPRGKFAGIDDKVHAVVLEDGRDFDAVVMAMAVDSFATACQRLCDVEPRWKRMCEQVQTVGTQAAQFWLKDDLHALGWQRGPVVLSGYCEPFDTWADMTHAVAAERQWRGTQGLPEDDAVRSIAYFCAVVPDVEPGGRPVDAATVQANARTFLKGAAAGLWPTPFRAVGGAPPTGLESLLVGATGRAAGSDESRLHGQYFRANTVGSQRYTLALPGTIRHRISPLDYSVANMTIAGDWTQCGFNEGCIEAAVMSGMLASHAISGRPGLDAIVGYHHP